MEARGVGWFTFSRGLDARPVEQYLYLVPFVTGAEGTRFLKTIIPSRKATRDYQRRRSS